MTVLTEAVDPASDRAVYKQIADHLRAAIGRGGLREGEQLPSEAQLMEHYGVARMTIRNALRVLQDEGLVTAEHGRGVYVRARPPVRRLASDRFAQRHRKEGMAAFSVEAAQVGARPEVDMLTVTRPGPRLRSPTGWAWPTTPRWWSAPGATCWTAGRWRQRCPTSRPTWPPARRSPTQPRSGRHLRAAGGAGPYPGPVHRGRDGPDADARGDQGARPAARRAGLPAGPHRL